MPGQVPATSFASATAAASPASGSTPSPATAAPRRVGVQVGAHRGRSCPRLRHSCSSASALATKSLPAASPIGARSRCTPRQHPLELGRRSRVELELDRGDAALQVFQHCAFTPRGSSAAMALPDVPATGHRTGSRTATRERCRTWQSGQVTQLRRGVERSHLDAVMGRSHQLPLEIRALQHLSHQARAIGRISTGGNSAARVKPSSTVNGCIPC